MANKQNIYQKPMYVRVNKAIVSTNVTVAMSSVFKTLNVNV